MQLLYAHTQRTTIIYSCYNKAVVHNILLVPKNGKGIRESKDNTRTAGVTPVSQDLLQQGCWGGVIPGLPM